MSITAMKQAADQLEIGLAYPGMRFYHDNIRAAITALRTAIEQAEKKEPVAWILEWIEDGEVYASKLYESERRCRYDAKKDTNAVCRPLVYGDKLKEKSNE